VDREAFSSTRCSLSPSICERPPVHRCVREGLGDTCRQCHISRSVVSGGVSPPHQCTRAEGGESSSSGVPPPSGLSHINGHRQYDGQMSHQPSRRDSLPVPHGGDSTALHNSSEQLLVSSSSPHSRQAQRAGRPAIQSGTDNTDGVDAQTAGGGIAVPPLGASSQTCA